MVSNIHLFFFFPFTELFYCNLYRKAWTMRFKFTIFWMKKDQKKEIRGLNTFLQFTISTYTQYYIVFALLKFYLHVFRFRRSTIIHFTESFSVINWLLLDNVQKINNKIKKNFHLAQRTLLPLRKAIEIITNESQYSVICMRSINSFCFARGAYASSAVVIYKSTGSMRALRMHLWFIGSQWFRSQLLIGWSEWESGVIRFQNRTKTHMDFGNNSNIRS